MKRGGVDYATWWPDDWGEYWVYGDEGSRPNYSNNPARTIKHSRQNTGGIFATEEDRDTFVKVNERYYELMDGVVLDWGDREQKKYEMYYNHDDANVHRAYNTIMQTQGVNYMTDEVYNTLCNEFTVVQLKLWVLGGARR